VTIPAEIFRAYDIRGIVGRSLTVEGVRDIGRALGSVGRERGAATFAVCRDGRLSGPELANALMEGLVAAGANAIDIGMGPTPLAYFAAHHLDCGSCVAVSGSHNPPEYNGLKMVVGGNALFGDDIQDLRKRIEQKKFSSGSGKRSQANVLDAYVDRIVGDVKLRNTSFTIGAGQETLPIWIYRNLFRGQELPITNVDLVVAFWQKGDDGELDSKQIRGIESTALEPGATTETITVRSTEDTPSTHWAGTSARLYCGEPFHP